MSYQSLTARYVFALIMVGIAALGGFISMYLVVIHASTHSLIVENLEEQEDLSQEVLKQASAFVHADSTTQRDTAKQALLDAVTELESNHKELLEGSDELGYPGDDTPELKSFLYEGESSLNAVTHEYLDRVRRLLSAHGGKIDENHPDVRFVLGEGARKLAERIQKAHLLFQSSANSRINKVLGIGGVLVGIIWIVLIVEAMFIFRPMARTIERERSELRRLNEELDRLATVDTLTGAYNRRKFAEVSQHEWATLRRTGNPMAILLVDVDHFKKVNDTHGHQAGDCVLRMVAAALSGNIREIDYLFRWGGEEFLVLAPNTAGDGALALAEKLRIAVENASMERLRVTISIGVTEIHSRDESFEKAIQRADAALYAAKENGRNQTRLADAPANENLSET